MQAQRKRTARSRTKFGDVDKLNAFVSLATATSRSERSTALPRLPKCDV